LGFSYEIAASFRQQYLRRRWISGFSELLFRDFAEFRSFRVVRRDFRIPHT
jgi:hypothetical protein